MRIHDAKKSEMETPRFFQTPLMSVANISMNAIVASIPPFRLPASEDTPLRAASLVERRRRLGDPTYRMGSTITETARTAFLRLRLT